MPSRDFRLVSDVRSGPDTRARRALAADSRVALLDFLVAAGRPVDAAEAAEMLGLHRNTARVHLEQLAGAGLVERHSEDRSVPGRPRILYSAAEHAATVAGVPSRADRQADTDYRELARVLAAQLAATPDPAAAAEQAGRRWSATAGVERLPGGPLTATEAIGEVTAVMAGLGFEPVADERRILLRRCPFAELAREERAVVCGVHLGMLGHTFDALDSPVAVDRLDPLVQTDPLLCVVHLTETPAIGAGPSAPSPPKRTRKATRR